MASETDSNKARWQSKRRLTAMWRAFKNIAIIFSFTVNLVLVIGLLLVVGWGLSPMKTAVIEPLLDNLQTAVNALETATIVRTIPIDEQVPINFVLPLKKPTTVILSQKVELVRPATFLLPGGGGTINGTVLLDLPKGLELPILLDLDVPVANVIPVRFPVEVTIPLKETELNRVVVELNGVLKPVRQLVDDLPDDF